jgi:hypothetical protein
MDRTINDIDNWRVNRLAYWLWQQRGSPLGSPGDDWLRAEEILGVRSPELELPPDLSSPGQPTPHSGQLLPRRERALGAEFSLTKRANAGLR